MKLCKHCDTEYPPTKEFFYTDKGKLKLDICKGCKKKRNKTYEKNRKPKDRREEYNAYNLKRKLAKQALTSKDI
jgi:hypothetical protein